MHTANWPVCTCHINVYLDCTTSWTRWKLTSLAVSTYYLKSHSYGKVKYTNLSLVFYEDKKICKKLLIHNMQLLCNSNMQLLCCNMQSHKKLICLDQGFVNLITEEWLYLFVCISVFLMYLKDELLLHILMSAFMDKIPSLKHKSCLFCIVCHQAGTNLQVFKVS